MDSTSLPAPGPSAQNLLAALAELLEKEYTALRQADATAVASIASSKRQLTDALAGPGIAAPTATGTHSPPDAVAVLARRCQDLNRRNGELLHLQQSMLTRAMRVLSGNGAGPTLYGARGQTHATQGGRHIASV